MEEYRIIKALSGFYYVQAEDGVVECRARGRFRRQDQSPLVGDFVRITRQGDKGVLEALLPRKNAFIRPAVVRHAWRKVTEGISIGKKDAGTKQDLAQEDDVETVETYQDALQFVVSHMPVDASKRNILVAHQFVTGASRCESEEVSVGGLDQIGAEVFDVFDYVALGHIHSPQHIGRETLRYCGTPLKYSFSEAEQKKSVVVMEIKEKGDIFIEKVPLKPLRDLRKIRGTYMELMSKDFYEGTETDDYLQITLTDEEDVPDGMAKLRTVYPNLMQLVYDNSRTRQSRQVEVTEHVEQKSEMELFEEFYEIQNNQPMSEEQQDFVRELMEELVH